MEDKKRIELTWLQGIIEPLVLCGAIHGVKASYDVKCRKFESELMNKADKKESNL